ncbi:MAG: hypothetical protein R2710_10140 [Acidimicrobiales bacterium]
MLLGYLFLNGGLVGCTPGPVAFAVAGVRAISRLVGRRCAEGTVQAGEFDIVQRVVAIGSWDAFITIYNNTERLFTVVLAAVVYLIAADRAWVTPRLRARLRRPASVGLATLTLGIGLAGILAPPSLLNGAYLWHRAGMAAVIFGVAWVGETLEPLGPRAARLVAGIGVVVFLGLSAARFGTVLTIADQRDEIRSLEAFLEPDDIVAAVSGPDGSTYTRAYPLGHVAGRMAAATDTEFLSNIFPASGESPMAYPDGTEFVWGRVPSTAFDAEPVVPTVFIAIGELDVVTARRLHEEGFHVVETSPSGLAALWRR